MDAWIRGNKIFTAIVVIVIVALGAIFINKNSQLELQKQPNETGMDAQAKCSSQAKAFFDYFATDPQTKQSDEYTNHYNSQLDRCFILVTHSIISVNDTYSQYLFDAIEKNLYGSYAWQAQAGKKYWDVPPIDCSLYLDGNQNNLKTCESKTEFDSFVETYMTH